MKNITFIKEKQRALESILWVSCTIKDKIKLLNLWRTEIYLKLKVKLINDVTQGNTTLRCFHD